MTSEEEEEEESLGSHMACHEDGSPDFDTEKKKIKAELKRLGLRK